MLGKGIISDLGGLEKVFIGIAPVYSLGPEFGARGGRNIFMYPGNRYPYVIPVDI